ncbi:tryptophan synthase subunit alpha [Clostridium felsineum]|uniref:tryptophan synthase subunit alpha n=1 Tax=Clostridium felsineum TaxID=36839 RepID=UPI00098C842D|nr:tryptophan synthase subunit alpha [Clostridium felsineum]URZ03448.1 Tryptophan synthase alpha chain [Clostridium felsineum]
MSNRIDLKFKELKDGDKKAMITFITSGYPDVETTKEVVIEMEKAGADLVELGIPYSDPVADGPVIQMASATALKNGLKIKDIMKLVKDIRKKVEIPIVYMGYFGCVFKYGIEKFITEAKEAGVDGMIIPDLPLEERENVTAIGDKYEFYIIPLVAPTSEERISKIVDGAKGFIYCVSTNGVTGVRNALNSNIEAYADIVSKASQTPKCVGFGISTPDMAKELKEYFDGVIIGSAVMKIVEEDISKEEKFHKINDFISEINKVL